MAGEEQARDLAVAEEIAGSTVDVLRDATVGVFLHGSLALGDYVPGRSDIDLLVVVERPLADAELRALQQLVLEHHSSASVAVDFRVVTRAAASSPTQAPPFELYVGLHAPEAPEIQTRVAGERDLVAELSIVRAHGRSLAGIQPAAVVGLVPDEWVVAYGDEILMRWQGLTDDADNAELMVLTACRIWRFATDGVYCSKARAGRWALARDSTLTAVTAALRQRAGELGVAVEPTGIARLLVQVRRELAGRGSAD